MGILEARFGFHSVDFILVVVDHYICMTKFFPISTTINAVELTYLFHNKIELKFGAPKSIVLARRLVFTSIF